MTYNEIIAKVSDDLCLPKGQVDKIYKSFWKAVREYITAIPLKKDLTDEEFLKLRPNVNIPSIGKLYVTLDRYKAIKYKDKRITQLKKNKDAAH